MCGAVEHLFPGQSDHVQRAVHEATCQDLLQVLREHGVVDTVVCSHVLPKKERRQRLTGDIWTLFTFYLLTFVLYTSDILKTCPFLLCLTTS